MNVTPAKPGARISASPIAPPGPVTKLNAPGGTPASASASASSRPLHGVVEAALNTTVLPAASAAPAGPPASANGKLNGAITSHGPYGRSTLAFSLTKPGSGSRAIGLT